MDRDILRQDMECAKYGRTREGAMEELQALDSCCCGLSESGTINDIYDVVKDDIGLLTFLDDIAKSRLRRNGEEHLPNTKYHSMQRVRDMLFGTGKLPQEIYGKPEQPTPKQRYFAEQDAFFFYVGNLDGWNEHVTSDKELRQAHQEVRN